MLLTKGLSCIFHWHSSSILHTVHTVVSCAFQCYLIFCSSYSCIFCTSWTCWVLNAPFWWTERGLSCYAKRFLILDEESTYRHTLVASTPLNSITRAKISKLRKCIRRIEMNCWKRFLFSAFVHSLIAQHFWFGFYIDLCSAWLICECLQLAWVTLNETNIHHKNSNFAQTENGWRGSHDYFSFPIAEMNRTKNEKTRLVARHSSRIQKSFRCTTKGCRSHQHTALRGECKMFAHDKARLLLTLIT